MWQTKEDDKKQPGGRNSARMSSRRFVKTEPASTTSRAGKLVPIGMKTEAKAMKRTKPKKRANNKQTKEAATLTEEPGQAAAQAATPTGPEKERAATKTK